MINRLKSYLCVYRRPIEIGLIIVALLLGGGVTGYAIGRMELTRIVATIRGDHLEEIARLQTAHRNSLALLASRLSDMTAQQSRTAEDVERAAQAARSAAATASGAAKNAAKANIRVKEIPAAPPKPESPFTEVSP